MRKGERRGKGGGEGGVLGGGTRNSLIVHRDFLAGADERKRKVRKMVEKTTFKHMKLQKISDRVINMNYKHGKDTEKSQNMTKMH